MHDSNTVPARKCRLSGVDSIQRLIIMGEVKNYSGIDSVKLAFFAAAQLIPVASLGAEHPF